MRPPRGRGANFRGGSGGRGGGGGRGFGGGRGGRGGFGGRGAPRDEGPPAEVVEISTFVHACEGEAVTRLTNEKIPYFNAPIYLENKTQIGKVEEIFGPINESVSYPSLFLALEFNIKFLSFCFLCIGLCSECNFEPFCFWYFSVKMLEGIVATSYSPGDKFYIDPAKLLPLARFLPQPKGQAQAARGGRGGGGGRGGRGGRGGGGFRGRGGPGRGRGGPPRGGRGGFRGGRGRY
ncbi:LOW QUALITY PROTEIN: hypothetical protein Cgig2_012210 [Carnegiea gigantea]|uniref:H/ACA ribonucleoprotein complex subunit n=1 Tax=Carnegiea gigantea TaxID=171969 RepID=A0A9Q1KTJ1_9CARY|nr:LOW QUALITY PROTEIN: hypothetical protein Cgig2_012210 [Carnegiea gigantea]